jgi:hypothetical protein
MIHFSHYGCAVVCLYTLRISFRLLPSVLRNLCNLRMFLAAYFL